MFAYLLVVIAAVAVPISANDSTLRADPAPRLLWQAHSGPCRLSKPVVGDYFLFLGACDGRFYSIDKRSGKVIWSHNANVDGASGEFAATPLLWGNSVIAGTRGHCAASDSGGLVYAFDRRTGAVHWKVEASINSNVFANISQWDPSGTLVFGTTNGEWLSINASKGKINWRVRATPAGASCETRTSVATDGESVCFLAQDKSLRCLDVKSGNELWKQKLDASPTTDVFVYKDVLYLGDTQGQIRGFIPKDGKIVVGLHNAFTSVGGFVIPDQEGRGDFELSYATLNGTGEGVLAAYNDEFGSVLWSRNSKERWSSNAPEPWRGLVVAGNCSGDVMAYRVKDGALLWQTRVKGCVKEFAHDESTIFVTVEEGAIYALHLPNSKQR